MAFFWNHFMGFLFLFGGAFLVAAAVEVFLKQRSVPGVLVYLALAAAFTAVGLLDLLDLLGPEWLGVSRNAVLGILGIWTGVSQLCSPPEPRFPRWTQWAMLVIGVCFVLAAISVGVRYYWA